MISAASSAVQGIMNSMRRMERAAVAVARAGLRELPATPGAPAASGDPAAGAAETDLASGMVEMLMAQRAFSAQLRVLRTADEMSREAVELGKR